MERSPYYPFPPRPGMKIEIAELHPEEQGVGLREDQVEDVISFEHSLYDLELDTDLFPSAEAFKEKQSQSGEAMTVLREIWDKKINFYSVGINYLLTGDGREAIGNIAGKPADYKSKEECLDFLGTLDISETNSKVLDRLQADSVNFEQEMVQDAFIKNGYKGVNVPAPEILRIYKNPEVILQKAKGYKQIKTYIKLAVRDLDAITDIDPDVKSAKRLLLDLYRMKVNKLIATDYVAAKAYLAQLAAKTENGVELTDKLRVVLPALSVGSDKLSAASLLQKMDEFRQGVSEDQDGRYTWLSPEAKKLAELAIENRAPAEIDRGSYSDIDPETLKNTEIDADTLGDMFRLVLSEYDLLSEHTAWDSQREGPTPDDKVQVIVDAKFRTLAYDDRQRVIQVPLKSRPLLKSLTGISHEITHTFQHVNKRAIGDLAILEEIGIDTTSEQAEAGAKWQERIAREILTGKEDTTIAGMGYYKALMVKDSGGTFGECLEAYFNQKLLQEPDCDREKAVMTAVGAVRRIFRNGGLEFAQGTPYITDTQPLSYLEQGLIYESLDEDERKFLFVGGVTIDNLKRLARVGLVDLDKVIVPKRKPIEILEPKVRELIAA